MLGEYWTLILPISLTGFTNSLISGFILTCHIVSPCYLGDCYILISQSKVKLEQTDHSSLNLLVLELYFTRKDWLQLEKESDLN